MGITPIHSSAFGQPCNLKLYLGYKQNTKRQDISSCASTMLVLFTKLPNPKICVFSGRS